MTHDCGNENKTVIPDNDIGMMANDQPIFIWWCKERYDIWTEKKNKILTSNSI